MSLESVFSFLPVQLASATAAVLEVHPHTAAALPATEGVALDELLQRLRACSVDEASLQGFGRSLVPRERRGLIQALLLGDAELDLRIEGALSAVLSAGSLGLLWRTWQRVPHSTASLSLLQTGVGQHGSKDVAGARWAEAVAAWLEDDPAQSIVAWADGKGLSLNDLVTLEGGPILRELSILRALWTGLLTTGSAAAFGREDDKEILERSVALAPDDRQAFGRHYLTTVPEVQWAMPILLDLSSAYGMPDARGSRPVFWRPVPEAVRDAFRMKVLSETLRLAFGDATDRHVFWSRWMTERLILEAKTGWAGSTQYAVLEFETFAAVEFFEVGHAAYFYPISEVDRLTTARPSHPRDLKQGDRRLVHMGRWQPRGVRMIRRLLARAP